MQPYDFPSLVSLIWAQPGFKQAWEILLAARETLKEVVFAPTRGSFDPPHAPEPANTIVMRSLEQLHVLNWQVATYFSRLKTPRLHTLTLPPALPAMVPFLEDVSPTLTTLVLHDFTPPSCLEILSRLVNVEHLVFSSNKAVFVAPYLVADAFFAQLAAPIVVPNSPPQWIWPKLATITLTKVGSFNAGTGESIMKLVRSRSGQDLDDRSVPRRLSSIVMEDSTSPEWLRNEVKRLLEHGTAQ